MSVGEDVKEPEAWADGGRNDAAAPESWYRQHRPAASTLGKDARIEGRDLESVSVTAL